jgi:SAM-dependent methyltransferase
MNKMIDDQANYLRSIRDQYESHPYPPRNPAHEKQRLMLTETEALGKISHYCFKGCLNIESGFRVLVAGGGTGDQTIFLAEQLRGFDAEVVYLDLSTASMQIAKRRAEIRQLDNITWVHGSILDLPKLGMGKFDYINSCGVLMILEDPVEGLSALKCCMKDTAAIGIMVYAKYGRTGVYHMQELMRLINSNEKDIKKMLVNAKTTFHNLPSTHCLKCGPVPLSETHAEELDDSDWYDLFLISQDRAYTVPQLYEWLDECGLNLISFASQRYQYLPETHIKDERLLNIVKKLPVPTQQAIAENLVSTISRHRFYTCISADTVVSIKDQDNIPYFCDILPLATDMIKELQAIIVQQSEGTNMPLHFRHENINIFLPIQKLTPLFLQYIDGNRTIREIIKAVKSNPLAKESNMPTTQVMHLFTQFYEFLNQHNLLLLRHKSTTAYKTYSELQS